MSQYAVCVCSKQRPECEPLAMRPYANEIDVVFHCIGNNFPVGFALAYGVRHGGPLLELIHAVVSPPHDRDLQSLATSRISQPQCSWGR